MRILLSVDNIVIGLGDNTSWVGMPNAYIAPDFIVQSGHMRWQYNGSDMNNQANWTELESTFEEFEIAVP